MFFWKEEEKEAVTAADGTEINREYHECVEEIKTEGQVLGSLQLHNEAMRRLEERRIANGRSINNRHTVTGGIRGRHRRRSDPKRMTLATSIRMDRLAASLGVAELTKSINAIAMNRRNSGQRNKSDASKKVMLGRRDSTMVPTLDDSGVFMPNNYKADIELSSSEDEDDGPQFLSQLLVENAGGRSASLFRRSSSRFSRTGDSGGGRRASLFRRSSSISSSTGESPTLRRTSSRCQSTTSSVSLGTESSPSVSDKSGDLSYVNNTIEEQSHQLNDKAKEELVSVNVGEDDAKDGGKPNTSNSLDAGRETSVSTDKKQLPNHNMPRRRNPNARTGRRRSSLFSVDERRASFKQGPSDRVSSAILSSTNSIGNSLNGSLTGSFSKGAGLKDSLSKGGKRVARDDSFIMQDGSLICSFGRMDSMRDSLTSSLGSGKGGSDDGDLICSWERKQPTLLDSMISLQPDDLLDEIENENNIGKMPSSVAHQKSNRTLICGWDPASSTMSQLSITEDELLKGEEDEKKESLSSPYAFGNASNRTLICTWDEKQTILAASTLSITEDLNFPEILQEGDEKNLLQAKEGCSLFDVRTGEVT